MTLVKAMTSGFPNALVFCCCCSSTAAAAAALQQQQKTRELGKPDVDLFIAWTDRHD